ncbi:MAG TPA: TIGR01777 family oxidoreductase [Phnomibacter sp.]|nr:TIGR01777 family oxidoreductase [Phnomibacter sp.]
MNNAIKTIAITGGTGLVGQALTAVLLQQGFTVIILTRQPGKQPKPWPAGLSYVAWNPASQQIDGTAMAAVDAIVNLAGAGVVAKPWTAAYKKEIVKSRTDSGVTLQFFLKNYPNRVQHIVQASAQGWYGGDIGTGPFTEDLPPAPGFLGETCQAWEASISPVTELGVRLTILRLGIVLSNNGGALAEFKKPLRFRVAGILGNGKQMVSWIHIQDVCGIILHALQHKLEGIFNTVAPNPVTNKQLTLALAKAMYGNGFVALPVPVFVLKIMLGSRSIEVLKSATVSAQKIEAAGYVFNYPAIKQAMAALAAKQ